MEKGCEEQWAGAGDKPSASPRAGEDFVLNIKINQQLRNCSRLQLKSGQRLKEWRFSAKEYGGKDHLMVCSKFMLCFDQQMVENLTKAIKGNTKANLGRSEEGKKYSKYQWLWPIFTIKSLP